MSKDLSIVQLVDCYGALLTPKQLDFMRMYYDEDLSLAEIAENEDITRQGVRDVIKRAEQILADFEDKLGLVRKMYALNQLADDAKNCALKLISLDNTTAQPDFVRLCQLIDEIKSTVNE